MVDTTVELLEKELERQLEVVNKIKVDIAIKRKEEEEASYRVEKHEIYWTILFSYTAGKYTVTCTNDSRYSSDNALYKSGNYFKTKDEAQREADRLNIYFEIRKWQRENDGDFTPTWDNLSKPNYALFYNYHEHTISTCAITLLEDPMALLFSSKQKVEQMIKEIGEDKIKRMLFGVVLNERTLQ